jgi:hypothetical protein
MEFNKSITSINQILEFNGLFKENHFNEFLFNVASGKLKLSLKNKCEEKIKFIFLENKENFNFLKKTLENICFSLYLPYSFDFQFHQNNFNGLLHLLYFTEAINTKCDAIQFLRKKEAEYNENLKLFLCEKEKNLQKKVIQEIEQKFADELKHKNNYIPVESIFVNENNQQTIIGNNNDNQKKVVCAALDGIISAFKFNQNK